MKGRDTEKEHIPHTRISNVLLDFVYPNLASEGEKSCLIYIVRRINGFRGKTWDRIALSQFEDGISSGVYPLDLGTAMSRPAIIKGLKSLIEKGIVISSAICPQCYWRGPMLDPNMRCTRCEARCEKAYELAKLGWEDILHFLNQYDKKKRIWHYDLQVARFYAEDGDGEDSALPVTREALAEFVNEIWYQDELRAIVKQAQDSSPNRKIKNEQLLRHYIQPMIQLQHLSSPDPGALKYAIEQTINHNIAGKPREIAVKGGRTTRLTNFRWHRYTKAIIEKRLADAYQAHEGMHVEHKVNIPGLERWVNDLLTKARHLNEQDEIEGARALLSEMLGKTEQLAELVGSKEQADALIRYAYKIGEIDFRGARHNLSPVYDYYPEWHWPKDLD